MGMTRKKAAPTRRSECPLNASVEMLGDRWSLLIIRDMMLQGARTYKTFLECYEGIATNILADRLQKLTAYGIITAKPDPSDGRKVIYLLPGKESIWRQFLPRWCSGPPPTKTPAIKPW